MCRSGKWTNFIVVMIRLRALLYGLSIGPDEKIDCAAMRAEGDEFARRRTRHPSNRNEGAQNQRYERDLSPNLSKDARHGLPPIFRKRWAHNLEWSRGTLPQADTTRM